MDLTDAATIVSPVVGLAGVGLAIWALLYSKQSRDIADKSSRDSAEAVGLAVKSNEIAIEAKGVAEEANTISRRAEDRELERHDIEWSHIIVEPDVYELRNDGTDTAHRVRATFYVDEWSAVGECDEVAPGESIRVEIPEAAEEFEREMVAVRQERREEERIAELRDRDPMMKTWIVDMSAREYQMPPTHNVGYRAVWQTPLGAPRVAEENWLEELGNHDDYA
ncbi:hypothetical protein ACPXB3_01305 [Gordonia sp. DT219]|uniref:hypothetical protein n=1 Tax=Gordonia sp. DT219 TaxID=3416658 RepID=UPI003CF2436E